MLGLFCWYVYILLLIYELFVRNPIFFYEYSIKNMIYYYWQLAPKGGVVLLREFITLIVAPTLVGLVLELVSRWLDEKDDN